MTPPPSGFANAAGSLRQEMAAASSICQISPTRCQARTRLYRDGRLELEGFPVADISDYLADGSVTIWLDLRGPDHDDLAVLSEEFGLHPLAVEAALRPSQRPKLDRYRSHLFLTAYAARLDAGHQDVDLAPGGELMEALEPAQEGLGRRAQLRALREERHARVRALRAVREGRDEVVVGACAPAREVAGELGLYRSEHQVVG